MRLLSALFLALICISTQAEGIAPSIYRAEFRLAAWGKHNEQLRRTMIPVGTTRTCKTFLFIHTMPFFGKKNEHVMFGVAFPSGELHSLVSRIGRDIAIQESAEGSLPRVIGIYLDKERKHAIGYQIVLPKSEYLRVRACLVTQQHMPAGMV